MRGSEGSNAAVGHWDGRTYQPNRNLRPEGRLDAEDRRIERKGILSLDRMEIETGKTL